MNDEKREKIKDVILFSLHQKSLRRLDLIRLLHKLREEMEDFFDVPVSLVKEFSMSIYEVLGEMEKGRLVILHEKGLVTSPVVYLTKEGERELGKREKEIAQEVKDLITKLLGEI